MAVEAVIVGERGVPGPWKERLAHRLLIEYFAERLFHLGETLDWDRLLAFLPTFDRPGFEFAHEVTSPGYAITHQDGTTEPISYYDWAPEVSEFHTTLYDAGVPFVFDWSRWAEAERFVYDPAALQSADEAVLRRLLTLHARAERFSEGHFVEMFNSGHMMAILRRARELRQESER